MDFTTASIREGAEAAMNGAFVSALSPPNCWNAVLNFSRLVLISKQMSHCFFMQKHTNRSEIQ